MNPKNVKPKRRRVEDDFADSRIESYDEDPLQASVEEDDDELKMLQHKPFINAISKERLDDRVEKVFALIAETLAKTYGPYGATTIISQYPYYHITKDGYTVQKSLAFDKRRSYVDQIICGLITDICGRLNYSVGDGTTTATIATNAIYQAYREMAEEFASERFLPRDIIKQFEEIKDYVIAEVTRKAKKINTLPKPELKKAIWDIAFVSSNGDAKVTEMIAGLYEKLVYPAISVTMATDGVTKERIINGYQFECVIKDKLYINSDDKVMNVGQSDILIFDHKIGLDTYTKILKPLASTCKNRGRHLICIAPFYDQVTLDTAIAPDLRSEYSQCKDINLVIMSCKYQTEHHKKMLNNFAVLCGTQIIGVGKDMELCAAMEKILTGEANAMTDLPFNLDNRGLIGTRVLMQNDLTGQTSEYLTETNGDSIAMKSLPDAVPFGYCNRAVLGEKTSIFSEFWACNTNLYDACVKEAEDDLAEMERKYQNLGSFNVEVDQAQERLNAVRLNVGILEVGADSSFSQGYLKDAIVDCVKATRSAYKYGVVPGCSVSILQALHEYAMKYVRLPEETDGSQNLKYLVWKIFNTGFVDVYRTILMNMDEDLTVDVPTDKRHYNPKMVLEAINQKYRFHLDTAGYVDTQNALKMSIDCSQISNGTKEDPYLLSFDAGEVIIHLSTLFGKPLDLTTGEFSDAIINSVETDIQILNATSDLIKLLITGNQLVVSMYGEYAM